MTSRTATVPRFRGNGLIEFEPYSYGPLGEGELLLAVGANAICGTDRHEFFDGSPIVPGHEAAGVVVEAGPGTRTRPGTRGAVYLMDLCGDCRSCRVGATNQCLAKRGDVGQNANGGYGPYLLTHESNFLPDRRRHHADRSHDAARRDGHQRARDRPGPAAARRHREPLHRRGRSDRAGSAGDGQDHLRRAVADCRFRCQPLADGLRRELRCDGVRRKGRGGHQRFRTGRRLRFLRPAARQTALSALSKRGALICVGHGESVTIDVSRELIAPERAVIGSEYFRYDEMPENLRRLQQHRELVGRVITHTFGVADIQQAFELFFSGQTGKVVITQEVAA